MTGPALPWPLFVVIGAIGLLLVSTSTQPLHAQTVTRTYLSQEIYSELIASPCIRLLNATGIVGCSSRPVSGIIYPISNSQDLDSLANNAQLSDSYIAVMPIEMLSRETVGKARNSGKIKGLIFREGQPRGTIASGTYTCPDCVSSPVKSHDWNPKGTGLELDSIDIPMFAIFNSSQFLSASLSAIDFAIAQNRVLGFSGAPLIAAELDAFMSGVQDANNCLRRGMCKPLGGFSVYSSFHQISQKSIIFLTATLDARSFFHELSQGAMSNIAGTVALLGAAQSLASLDTNQLSKHIAFGFFTGEQFDHIGSRSFVKDLAEFDCKEPFTTSVPHCTFTSAKCAFPCAYDTNFTAIKLDKISHVLDANYLGSGGLRIHASSSQLATTLIASAGAGILPAVTTNDAGLPPSPALAFAERNPQINLTVVSTLDKEFPSNHGTEYDDATAALTPTVISNLCNASQFIARAAHTLAQDTPTNSTLTVNCTYIERMMRCALLGSNETCPFGFQWPFALRPNHYTSVSTSSTSPMWLSQLVYTAMVNITGTRGNQDCSSKSPCSASDALCLEGKCVQAPFTYYHQAIPPGLAMDRDKARYVVANASLPHWVESDWDRSGVRLYYQATTGMQAMEVTIGLALTGLSVLLAWRGKAKFKQD